MTSDDSSRGHDSAAVSLYSSTALSNMPNCRRTHIPALLAASCHAFYPGVYNLGWRVYVHLRPVFFSTPYKMTLGRMH